MLAGEQGTGKTTIARYLVGYGPTKITISTDGIDLFNGLSFIDRENKKWLRGKQVLDGSRTLDDPCPFEQYLQERVDQKQHEEDVELKRQQLFLDIEKMFSGSTLLSHLVIKDQIFVNAKNARDPEMVRIKGLLLNKPFFNNLLGAGNFLKCFILLLEVEFDSLVSRNIPMITMEHMKQINSLQPVRPLTEDEMKEFLKFQHSVGRILYFEEPKLDECIILAPTHLIDAFKSIVTDRRFCAGDRLRQESWI
ncbi:unnamed protein product [Mytilus edulis]|uniref:Uncharacterized protein n=1 Tax=Mytilus edulis TaxID=6550 RepID=A0A8S3QM28_MYTED|nr:unnamed protein product [Mytilus edulis]